MELPYTITLPSIQSVIVHAGLIPGESITQQSAAVCSKLRNSKKGFLGISYGYEKGNIGKSWAAQWKGPYHVYYGHDAKKGLQLHPFATGLDTGCCYGTSYMFHI